MVDVVVSARQLFAIVELTRKLCDFINEIISYMLQGKSCRHCLLL